MSSPKKKKSSLFSKFLTLLILIVLGVFAYSVYQVVETKMDLNSQEKLFDDYRSLIKSKDEVKSKSDATVSDNKEDTSENITTKKKRRASTHDYSEIYALNSDFVGWITVNNTNIDYPVVHTPDDPEYYLRLDLNHNYASAGTCFVGEGCDVDSDSFIIYGHNMDNDTMFGTLDYYKEKDFWKDNQLFDFNTMDEDRTYRIFAAFEISIYDDNFKYFTYVGDLKKKKKEELIEKCLDYSMYQTNVDVDPEEQILMLSTCSYHTAGGRFVVAAVFEN